MPRSRFSPVKTTEDLLGVRSDAYVLTDDSRVELAPERDGSPPVIDLDDDHFKLIATSTRTSPRARRRWSSASG